MNNGINYLDLFSGIGGFAYGAWLAGMKFESHFFSEVDPFCVKLYQKRFPDAVALGDITKIDFEKLKRDYPGEWIIAGGFPCQDISVAGKGAGIEGERSGLWYYYREAIRVLRPKYTIIENVGALTVAQKKKYLFVEVVALLLGKERHSRLLDLRSQPPIARILEQLSQIGYDAEWQDIRAEDVGAPHKRERLWIVAYPSSIGCNQRTVIRGPLSKKTWRPDVDNGSNAPSKIPNTDGERCQELFDRITERPGNFDRGDGRREVPNTSGQRLQNRPEEKSPSQRISKKSERHSGWAVEPEVGRLANGIPRRVDQLRGLGNSIVPQIAAVLFSRIKELLL